MQAREQVVLSDAPPMDDVATSEVELAVRAHARMVYQIAYSVLRNPHDAEDATQETFLRFLRQKERLSTVRDVKAYLARAAWRVAGDLKRNAAEVSYDDAAAGISQARACGASAEEIAAGAEMSRLLERMIASLPRDLRETLTLSTVEELSSPEISEILGIPQNSVRTRLLRARQILREKLATALRGPHGR
jgi:RNA polymerase sigma-70 factor, ECF subfamily